MISRTSDKPDLNKYATKTLENDYFVDLEDSKLSKAKNKSKAIAYMSYANYHASGGHCVTNFW